MWVSFLPPTVANPLLYEVVTTLASTLRANRPQAQRLWVLLGIFSQIPRITSMCCGISLNFGHHAHTLTHSLLIPFPGCFCCDSECIVCPCWQEARWALQDPASLVNKWPLWCLLEIVSPIIFWWCHTKNSLWCGEYWLEKVEQNSLGGNFWSQEMLCKYGFWKPHLSYLQERLSWPWFQSLRGLRGAFWNIRRFLL